MSFHLGKPILVMLMLAVLSGGAIFLRTSPRASDLKIWCFSDPHAESLREASSEPKGPSLVERYRMQTGRRVGVDLVTARAIDVRLLSLFMSADQSGKVPDLAEIEINSVGKFFNPPLSEVGWYPLDAFLDQSGWRGRMIQTRLAPWTKKGTVFGIPHDVHPVTLTYRKDLFDQAGVDLQSAGTWAEFQERCLAFQSYWKQRGQRRRAFELNTAAVDALVVMLLQRGINLIDDSNRVYLTDPKVAATVAFYAQLVAGNRAIAEPSSPGAGWTRDLASGDLCSMLTPDWRVQFLQQNTPELKGRVRMMPLPRFEPSDAPTSTWGGTMIGIPRHARDPRESWRLLEQMFLTPPAIAARRQHTSILPPVIEALRDPIYQQPDDFFAGQPIYAMYADLAMQIPPRYVTPYTGIASAELSSVLVKAIAYQRTRGPVGLESACAGWLRAAAMDLQRWIDFGRFD